MVAANKNYVDIVDALLEGGADPNQPQQVSEGIHSGMRFKLWCV